MKVVDFTGKEHKINLALYLRTRSNCSSLHKSARQLLTELFPFTTILEEVPLPGTKMFVDFFLPDKKLMVEVQGEQHYKFNGHFFANKSEFLKAQARDARKAEWAEINGLQLIEFPYNEDKDGWTKRITSRND
jgi:hypothetical protein